MELDDLLEKIQFKLVQNDELLERIDARRAELKIICKGGGARNVGCRF